MMILMFAGGLRKIVVAVDCSVGMDESEARSFCDKEKRLHEYNENIVYTWMERDMRCDVVIDAYVNENENENENREKK